MAASEWSMVGSQRIRQHVQTQLILNYLVTSLGNSFPQTNLWAHGWLKRVYWGMGDNAFSFSCN